MRCWHQDLIPKLCRQHLLGMWRECNGMYKIITENKKGYRNHPAVKEFEECPNTLWWILFLVRKEMIKRNYNPKELPEPVMWGDIELRNHWQTLEQQIEILKSKGCKCKI